LTNRAGHNHQVYRVCLVSVPVISFKIILYGGHLAPHFTVVRNGTLYLVNDTVQSFRAEVRKEEKD